MTSPDFEALHYQLAPTTDWSSATLHESATVLAESDDAAAADPRAADGPAGGAHDRPPAQPADRDAGGSAERTGDARDAAATTAAADADADADAAGNETSESTDGASRAGGGTTWADLLAEFGPPHTATAADDAELGTPGTFGATSGALWGQTTYAGPRRHRPKSVPSAPTAVPTAVPPVPSWAQAAPEPEQEHEQAELPADSPVDAGAGASADSRAEHAPIDDAILEPGSLPAEDVAIGPSWTELLDAPSVADGTAAPLGGAPTALDVPDELIAPPAGFGISPFDEPTGLASLEKHGSVEQYDADGRDLGASDVSSVPWPPPAQTDESQPIEARETRGLLANSRTMAIASLASRVTGFLRTAAIAAALGVVGNGVADAYNLANTLPNMVYELLIGGVLSSVLIPLLVRAQQNDRDGGLAYTQRLLAVATAALAGATVVAAAGAPLLTWALVDRGAQRDLATAWATILLPEIFFYGVGALFTAVLNARNVYAAPAWAPVLNNVLILVTVAVYLLLPGPAILTPSTITTAQILVLGVGTTLGIAVQATILIPWLRKVGFTWSWRFRAPAGSASEGGFKHERNLISWVIGYVVASQIGLLVITRIAVSRSGLTTFTSADLLFQVPYGILGVSLLTALMPRMSRSAARGDFLGVLADLSLGVRLSALAMLPITAGLMVMGPSLGTVIFRYGETPPGDARHVGIVLALAAFGLLPFALVMLQLRVFYAMHDAKTPTLINVFMVATKVVLVLIAAATLPTRHVIEALSVSTSASYVVGAVVGHVLLQRRLGNLGLGPAVGMVGKVAGASAVGALIAWALAIVIEDVAGTGRIGSLAVVLVGSAVGGAACLTILWRLRLPELRDIVAASRRPAGSAIRRVPRA